MLAPLTSRTNSRASLRGTLSRLTLGSAMSSARRAETAARDNCALMRMSDANRTAMSFVRCMAGPPRRCQADGQLRIRGRLTGVGIELVTGLGGLTGDRRLRLAAERLAGRGIELVLGRQRRTMGFGRRTIHAFVNVFLDPLQSFLELDDALAQALAHFRQALTEQEQSDDCNDNPFGPHRHTPGKHRVHIKVLSNGAVTPAGHYTSETRESENCCGAIP